MYIYKILDADYLRICEYNKSKKKVRKNFTCNKITNLLRNFRKYNT